MTSSAAGSAALRLRRERTSTGSVRVWITPEADEELLGARAEGVSIAEGRRRAYAEVAELEAFEYRWSGD